MTRVRTVQMEVVGAGKEFVYNGIRFIRLPKNTMRADPNYHNRVYPINALKIAGGDGREATCYVSEGTNVEIQID